MLAQNLLQGCLMNLQSVQSTKSSQNSTVKGAPVKFKDILQGTVAKGNPQQSGFKSVVKINQNTDGSEQVAGQKPVSYRDAAAKETDDTKTDDTKKVEVQENKAIAIDRTQADTETVNLPSESDAIVNSLAQLLGLDQKELQTMLNFLNIRPQELTDPSKASDIAQRLSTLTGLNEKQEETLGKLIEAISQKADKVFVEEGPLPENEDVPALNNPDQSWVTTGIKDIEVIDRTKPSQELKNKITTIKENLDMLSGKLVSNPEQTILALSESIDKLLDNYKAKTEKLKVSSPVESTETFTDAAKTSAKTTEASAKATGEPSGTTQTNKPLTVEKEAQGEQVKADTTNTVKKEKQKEISISDVKQAPENTEIAAQPTVQPVVQQVDAKNVSKLEDIPEVTTIDKHEILGQVVEKAKVLLNDGKSEMVMTLKPESLGKLSLKVVTENGIITAKFEAESQQVKQVLETNMQLLKDSLEKQGLTVQGFSVSVNDGRQEQPDSRRYFRQAVKSTVVRGVVPLSEVSALRNLRSINPYEAAGISSINLTA